MSHRATGAVSDGKRGSVRELGSGRRRAAITPLLELPVDGAAATPRTQGVSLSIRLHEGYEPCWVLHQIFGRFAERRRWFRRRERQRPQAG
jgi:hypothetical protein